jgi:hypothetical protein
MHKHETNTTHSHTTNGHQKATVAAQNFDDTTLQVLQLSRMFFVSFNQPETEFWMKAYGFGEHVFGAPLGATVAQAILTMLNEMRCARPHTFNFTDPRCLDCSAFLTPEERYLMESFVSLRAGKHTSAQMSAMMLCEGKDPSRFLQAAKHLSDVLEQASIPTRYQS